MENEEEISSGHKNTKFRKLDARIGRWLSVDPAADMYYSWSPYNLSMNNPLANSDPSGATVVVPQENTEERKMYDESMKVPEFAEQIGYLEKSKDVFKFSLLKGDNGYIEQDEYVNRSKEDGGDYTKFTIHFGKSNPKQLNGLGKSELHPLFEEVFHTADYVEQRSSSMLVKDKNGSFRLGHKATDLQHEARAWTFAANYAPNPVSKIERKVGSDNVRIPDPLVQRIRLLNSNPENPNPQISKWLYGGFQVKIQFLDKAGAVTREGAFNFDPVYKK